MDLVCQQEALIKLREFAAVDRHSVLIEGPEGCGKSYLAKQYAKMLGVDDFSMVVANVQSIREALDCSYNLENRVVFCIENLDTGAAAASYTLLKFLEEPTNKVYLVITCRNLMNVPATIHSRCTIISTSAPASADIVQYAEIQNFVKFQDLKNQDIWRAVRTFKDADMVLRLTSEQLSYFYSLKSIVSFSDTIQNMSWKLGHYDDNSSTNLQFVMNYLMILCNSPRVSRYAIECSRDLSSERVASHAVLAKFLFECKYGD